MAGAPLNGRYEVVRRLGSGAEATVFLVRDLQEDGATRALKLVTNIDSGVQERLVGEFRRLTQLEHPHLVRVYELDKVHTPVPGFATGTQFFTCDYVDGVEPGAQIVDVDDRVEFILRVADDVAQALAHVHSAGLVHCDVKPGNILVTSSTPAQAILLDLGLSCARGVAGAARGTLAYMAPESLAGVADPRADFYALGATLYELATGESPYSGTEPSALVRAICAGRIRPVSDRCDWLPGPVASLITRLLSTEASDRHSHAAVLLDDLARVREELDLPGASTPMGATLSTLLPPRIVGREPILAALQELADSVARARPKSRLIQLVGPAGVGKRALVREAIRRQQLAFAAGDARETRFVRGSLDELARQLVTTAAPELPDGRATQRFVDDLLAHLVRQAGRAPTIYVITDTADDERVPILLRAVDGHATLTTSAIGFVVLSDAEPDAGGSAPTELLVPPLSESQIGELAASMIGRTLPRPWVAALAGASDGLPRAVSEILRTVVANVGIDGIHDVSPDSVIANAGADIVGPLYVKRVESLAREDSALVEALAVLGGSAELAAAAATLSTSEADCAERAGILASMGMVRVDRSRVALPSKRHSEAVCEALPAARNKALRRSAIAYLNASGNTDPVALADHRIVTGPAAEAVRACDEAATLLAARGQARRALPYAQHAARVATGASAADAKIRVAEIATALGDYDEAIAAATEAARSRTKPRKRRAQRVLARAHQKRGDLELASEILAALLQTADGDSGELRGSYSRLLISRGRYEDAIAAAGVIDEDDHSTLSTGDALRVESVGLAQLYLGDITTADRLFAHFEQRAQLSAERSVLGRALGLRGMVAQMTGRIAAAARLYERAEEQATTASDIHAAAVYALNRATAQSAQGRHGDAIAALARAEQSLRRLGNVAELAAVRFNRGLALLALGELPAARRAAHQAFTLAETEDAPQMQIYARLLEGDIDVREGDLAGAEAKYRMAVASAEQTSGGRDLLMAQLNLAKALAAQGDRSARAVLGQADEGDHGADDMDRIAIARGRVALALSDELKTDELDAAREHTRQAGSIDLAWRADLVAARIARASNDNDRAKDACRAARELVDTIIAHTPEARRPGLATDPDLMALAALEMELDLSVKRDVPLSPPVGDSQGYLRRLLSLSRRLNSELRLMPLLDEVIDAVIELTSAERGFLLLYQGSADLEVLVARNFDQSSLSGDEVRVSRSIAEKAARTGEVVLTVDAAFDDRFDAADSVAALRLRSVLAVPLRQKGRIVGTIYVDHRFRRGAFDDEAVELVRELADIAAVAIENARLVEENQRRQESITELNRRLEQEMTAKEAELATVKARLAADPQQGLRHAYDAIIGRSQPMVDMLTELDRATDTNLPVVICGESGTGKELVARALHQNGPRRNKPFVAVNCGAVAEELLESELFGHVRGAFTSADRDRHGLFEVADGGTLFLDEVADTSLAMQAKLLRVLQEGEIRRVGDHQVRRVNVRIVAATNRGLPELVAAGVFREDLFYRLNVLPLALPPLRQRVEDIPTLTQHILNKLSGDGPAPTMTRAAIARLSAYAWPGNVRELENELARATALGGDPLDVDALSPHIATLAPVTRPSASGELKIKPQVETLERGLVEEALRRTNNNQTAAAKLLGLSRYGLQKKLKRYGIARA